MTASAVASILAFPAPSLAQFVKYGPANFWGGYKEEIRPGVWRVSASLNAASGGGPGAKAMANYRAAELIGQKGFTHMRVLRHGGFEHGQTIGTVHTFSGGPGHARLTVRGARNAADVDGCLMSKPDRCVTVSVEEVMDRWRRYIRFRSE